MIDVDFDGDDRYKSAIEYLVSRADWFEKEMC